MDWISVTLRLLGKAPNWQTRRCKYQRIMTDIRHLHLDPVKIPALFFGKLLAVFKKVSSSFQTDFSLPIRVGGGIKVLPAGNRVRKPQIDRHGSFHHFFETILVLQIFGQFSKTVPPIPVQPGKGVRT
ncbi:hypothetical protein EBT11_06540 [bacterium]|nr:hypothetical protein [bacterium]